MHMNRLAIEDGPTDYRSTAEWERFTLGESRDGPEVSPLLENIALDPIDVRVARATYPGGALGDRVKDWLDLGWRAGDHPEDFAGCRLPLECFFRLVEQAHVLYRDRGLVGERFEQTDLVGRECVWFCSSQDENADDVVAAFQRDADERSDVEDTGASVVLGVGTRIDDRGRSSLHQDAAGQATPVRVDRLIAPVPLHAFWIYIADVRDQPPAVGFQLRDRSVVRGAQPDRIHRHALEDSLQIEHRLAHVLQDFGDRRLAVEGVRCPFDQASVLDGDDGLIRECAHEGDLPIGEWADLVPG